MSFLAKSEKPTSFKGGSVTEKLISEQDIELIVNEEFEINKLSKRERQLVRWAVIRTHNRIVEKLNDA